MGEVVTICQPSIFDTYNSPSLDSYGLSMDLVGASQRIGSRFASLMKDIGLEVDNEGVIYVDALD